LLKYLPKFGQTVGSKQPGNIFGVNQTAWEVKISSAVYKKSTYLQLVSMPVILKNSNYNSERELPNNYSAKVWLLLLKYFQRKRPKYVGQTKKKCDGRTGGFPYKARV
jgi:hypothetical protein